MICVKCGKPVTETIKGLCPHCYSKSKNIFSLPPKLDLEHCSHCGSYKIDTEWRRDKKTPQMILHKKIHLDPYLTHPDITIDTMQNPWRIHCQGNISGTKVTETYTLPVKIHGTACPRCSMIMGGYYEAILQIRGTHRDISKKQKTSIHTIITKKITESQDPKAFITKIDETRQGIDYYLGEQHIAESLARTLKQRFHATTKKSVTLMGVQDGQKVYRVTHLIRLPSFAIQDFIKFQDTLYQVQDMKTQVTLRNLSSGDMQSFPYKELVSVDILHPEIKNALIISETKKELQIMDPDTYKTWDIAKPRDYSWTDDEIPILKWGNYIYLLPGERTWKK